MLVWKIASVVRRNIWVKAIADLCAHGVAFVSLPDTSIYIHPRAVLRFQAIGAMAEFDSLLGRDGRTDAEQLNPQVSKPGRF